MNPIKHCNTYFCNNRLPICPLVSLLVFSLQFLRLDQFALFISPMHDIWPALDLTSLILLGEENKLWSTLLSSCFRFGGKGRCSIRE
jgi:hypothetical protein